MPIATIYQDWRSEQSASRYPFADSATLTNGTSAIPLGSLVDARIYLIGGDADVYLERVEVNSQTVVMTISDGAGLTATGSFPQSDPVETLELLDEYSRPAGALIGADEGLAAFGLWPEGTHSFTRTQTAFAATAVIPTPQAGVRGFRLESGEIFTGDVWLLGEQGVFFTKEDGNIIRVDIIGDPAARKKFCSTLGNFTRLRPLRTFAGLGGNEFGDFKLLSGSNAALDTVLRIRPNAAGLHLSLVGGVSNNAAD